MTDVAQHRIDGEWTGSDSVSESIDPGQALTDTGIAAEVAPGAVVQHVRRAGRRGRGDRAVELTHAVPPL